jgi:hypothetical protein
MWYSQQSIIWQVCNYMYNRKYQIIPHDGGFALIWDQRVNLWATYTNPWVTAHIRLQRCHWRPLSTDMMVICERYPTNAIWSRVDWTYYHCSFFVHGLAAQLNKPHEVITAKWTLVPLLSNCMFKRPWLVVSKNMALNKSSTIDPS